MFLLKPKEKCHNASKRGKLMILYIRCYCVKVANPRHNFPLDTRSACIIEILVVFSQLIVQHYKVYYPVRHHLIQHIVSSVQKLGLTPNVCVFSSLCSILIQHYVYAIMCDPLGWPPLNVCRYMEREIIAAVLSNLNIW